MCYRIVYEGQKRQNKNRKSVLLSILLCLSIILCIYFGGKRLLPVDTSQTGEALETMVSSIVSGDTLSDAVTAFCQEILDNARNAK